MPAKRLRVHGLVQGIGYRESMRREAEKLGLSGWVRNRRDGSVEVVVCGADEAVAAIIAWAHTGPRSAIVERVLIVEEESMETGTFLILPTA